MIYIYNHNILMVKLFVSGFPLDMEEVALAKMFFPYGNVQTIKLVRDRKTRICKGYGFIEMADMESAENAVSGLNQQPFGDRLLTVNISPDEPPKPFKPRFNTGGSGAPSYKKVFKPNDPNFKPKRPRKRI